MKKTEKEKSDSPSVLSPVIPELATEFPLTDWSEADINLIYDKLSKARDERSIPRKEFDGMVFEQDYERNREATFSYLRPKKNDDDVRVNSGTSEKKIELMHNELMSMNFQPNVRAFDKRNLELVDLGADFTDLVRKTNTQEKDEDMYGEVILDLLTQRAAFIEECLVPADAHEWYGHGAPGYLIAKKRRLSPLQVYLGDMFIPMHRIHEQPYIVIYDRMLYGEAKVLFGKNENWKYVQPGNIHDEYIPWFKYRFSTLRSAEVEVVTIMSSSAHDDYYQQIVNGVPMHKKGTKMPKRKGYPIVGATAKQISDFAYGKPPLASAKFLQALQDETLRNLIRKMRQAIEPPMGVANGKTYTRDVWSPGASTPGLVRDNFSRLIDHQGVTSSEFQMFQLITQKAEEFIGMANITNTPGQTQMTATQILELQKQSIKMLGMVVLAISRLKRDATFLRLDSILTEYFKPLKSTVEGKEVKNEYRTFEITDAKSATGKTIQKYIILADKLLSKAEIENVIDYEDKLSAAASKEIRYSFIDAKKIKTVPLLFHVEVAPEQRDSGALDKVMFQDRLAQSAQIAQLTGRRLSPERIIADFESTWQSKGWFEAAQKTPEATPEQTGVEGQAQELLGKIGKMQQSVPRSDLAQRQQAGMASILKQPR